MTQISDAIDALHYNYDTSKMAEVLMSVPITQTLVWDDGSQSSILKKMLTTGNLTSAIIPLTNYVNVENMWETIWDYCSSQPLKRDCGDLYSVIYEAVKISYAIDAPVNGDVDHAIQALAHYCWAPIASAKLPQHYLFWVLLAIDEVFQCEFTCIELAAILDWANTYCSRFCLDHPNRAMMAHIKTYRGIKSFEDSRSEVLKTIGFI